MYLVVEAPRSKMCWFQDEPPVQLTQVSIVNAVAVESGVDGIMDAKEVVPSKVPAFEPPNGPAPPSAIELLVALRVPAESARFAEFAASSKRYWVTGVSAG